MIVSSASLRKILSSGTALAVLACTMPGVALAQTSTTVPETQEEEAPATGGEILVTGSRIKQNPNNSALPLQIITPQEMRRDGINSPEQLIMMLSTNGNGADNLSSNADVISTGAAQRGASGASFANLRGQGAASTLVLLNGRRVAAHGLSGSAVDVNQIPFAAIERVEVLKDGASAIYGTDAVGGVLNFITKQDFTGLSLNGFTDVTQLGDSPSYRLSATAGWGDLAEQGFNVMGAVSKNWVGALQGNQRDFINLFQYNRALAPETRGTPFGTLVPLAGTVIASAATAPFAIGSTTQRVDAINVLNLPGREGCGVTENQSAYDYNAWNIQNYRYSCAFDSARSAYVQQAQETFTYYGRAVARLGRHDISLELTGSDATADKVYSEIQLTPNTTTQNYVYNRVVGVNEATYDMVYDRLAAAFPTYMSTIARGTPLAYRWRCMECGPREVLTDTSTFRGAVGAEGPLFAGWDYRAGASYAESKSSTVLGGGYYYTTKLMAALNTGIINPFLLPGQTQSKAAMDLLASTSARGEEVYHGKYSVTQADASIAGPVFGLPGGDVQLAVGVDYRKEKYSFYGNLTTVYAAPTDNGNNIAGVSREIKAAYAEALFPLLPGLDFTAAVRVDDYSGFGSTTNPKFSVKYRPFEPLLFRASYNTSFRVPSFNQIYNGRTSTPYTGSALVDPAACPSLVATTTGACARVSPADQISGGNPNLQPETAKQASAGVVIQPTRDVSLSVDWWMINREHTIQIFTLAEIMRYYNSLSDRFIRNSSNTITGFDLSWANAGASRTQALEIAFRGGIDALGGRFTAGLDGTYLLVKKDKVVDQVEYQNKIGVFSLSGDLGLRWKHNAFVSYATDDISLSFSQIFRDGYDNRILPGVTAGTASDRTDIVYRVKNYITYNLSVAYTGFKNFSLTAGIRNLFDTDPPFAISYDDNTGGGSSYEPRVADPRGRSFTLAAEVKF
jgi:iron complex outermembrane recepter protein